MICEKCKKNEATIHLSEVIKDQKSEVHLCESCAMEVGLNTKISGFSLSLPDMLTFLNVDEVDGSEGGNYCQLCGSDFLEYKKEGKLGCPECYNSLSEFIEPVMAGFHGDNRHIGKFPAEKLVRMITETSPVHQRKNDEYSIEYLQEQLEAAVSEERYEDAALLRDRIRESNLLSKG